MHILISAPIPSHPQTHGNRARLFRIASQLKARGALVSFIYCGNESISQASELAMRRFFDNLIILPPANWPKKPARGSSFGLDDWAHPAMENAVADFLGRWRIDAALANYIWASRWLESLPGGIKTFIDTHDIFGDRHKVLAAQNMAPSFYYTSPAEEARALDRADVIIAIQDEEAATLRARNPAATVVTVGHSLDLGFEPDDPLFKAKRPLTVGYFASDNPINQASLGHLISAINAHTNHDGAVDWLLMGSIVDTAVGAKFPGRKQQSVATPTDFYQAVDMVINPHMGGTGLKIKSVEALSYGKPLVGTPDALVGLYPEGAAVHPAHRCADARAVVDTVYRLAGEPQALADLTRSGRQVISGYRDRVARALEQAFSLPPTDTSR